MRLHSLFSRRPSPALAIASLALFVSLGGVGYAAVTIPNNSVGTAQLQNNSVTGSKIPVLAVGYRKIQLGAVGTKQINSSQVQIRVGGKCTGNTAIAAIDNMGKTTCAPTTPKEFGNTAGADRITISPSVQSLSLPAGSSYLLLANPQVTVPGGSGSQVQVSCTLATSPGDISTTQTRSVTFQPGARDQTATLALSLPAPSVANGSTAGVSCTQAATGGSTPATTVASSLNALQTTSNS